MRGTVTNLHRSLSGMFFIEGDDVTMYFSHVHNARDKKNTKRYLYNGNKAEFSVIDEGGNHLTATDVFFDEVADPDAERKREIRIAEAENRRINEEKKKEAYVRNLEEQVRFYQNMDMERREKYVIQHHTDEGWENFTYCGKLIIFNDPYKAKEFITVHKQDGIQMRARKARVSVIKGKTIVREISK